MSKKFWAKAVADGVTVISIDSEIVGEDWFDDANAAAAKNFRKALAGAGDVVLRINSPGGDVFAASDMYAAMIDHKGTVTVEITGIAASAASVIAMAGTTVRMAPTATMMIHNPWTMAAGDSKALRKEAKVLDEVREGLINAYELKTGISRERLKTMLDNETWMNADTAVALGFADEVIGKTADDAEEEESAVKTAGLFQRRNSFEKCYAAMLRRRAEDAPEEDEDDDPETDEESTAPSEGDEKPEEPAEETEEPEEAETEEEKADEDQVTEESEEDGPEEGEDEPEDEETRRAQLRALAAQARAWAKIM